MRLNDFQILTILNGVKKICGQNANVWLFGSRVDDTKRGGDIDLYIEVDEDVSVFDAKLKLMSYFQNHLGEQKIDILIRTTLETMNPIHEIARQTGVLLK